eukprot:SM013781S00085  [mRNA]  locus=s13781:134:223:+ [translate_table: standard]
MGEQELQDAKHRLQEAEEAALEVALMLRGE